MVVRIIAVSDKSRTLQGKVSRIHGEAIEKNNVTIIPVDISFDNPINTNILAPGYNVDVKFLK